MAIRIRTPLPAREQGWVFLVIIVLVVNQLIKGLGFMSGDIFSIYNFQGSTTSKQGRQSFL